MNRGGKRSRDLPGSDGPQICGLRLIPHPDSFLFGQEPAGSLVQGAHCQVDMRPVGPGKRRQLRFVCLQQYSEGPDALLFPLSGGGRLAPSENAVGDGGGGHEATRAGIGRIQ